MTPFPDDVPIFLIGFKGCGKSTIGARLANRLDLPFIDTDQLIEAAYEKETGEKRPFREVYRLVGEQKFRAMERSAVEEALAGGRRVVAFGGGALLTAIEAGLDLARGIFVHITVAKDILYQRIMKEGPPAFFDPERPKESFEGYYEERAPVYNRYAALKVDNSGDDPEDAASVIAAFFATIEEDYGG